MFWQSYSNKLMHLRSCLYELFVYTTALWPDEGTRPEFLLSSCLPDSIWSTASRGHVRVRTAVHPSILPHIHPSIYPATHPPVLKRTAHVFEETRSNNIHCVSLCV